MGRSVEMHENKLIIGTFKIYRLIFGNEKIYKLIIGINSEI